MKRQAIEISLLDLEKLKEIIKKERKEIEELGIKLRKNTKMLLPIVNYPTRAGKKRVYCSDTWEFEGLRKKK